MHFFARFASLRENALLRSGLSGQEAKKYMQEDLL
jgi:hypothetical protein